MAMAVGSDAEFLASFDARWRELVEDEERQHETLAYFCPTGNVAKMPVTYADFSAIRRKAINRLRVIAAIQKNLLERRIDLLCDGEDG